MRVAIFGGAFNPVHREHVNLAKQAVEALNLDRIIIMPTAVSPHKSGKLQVDFAHRLEMCRIAFSSIPRAEVSDFEFAQGGVSYTYLTCEHFAQIYQNAERYLIMGYDMLESFPAWRNPERIVNCFNLVACAREKSDGFTEAQERVEEQFGVRVVALPYVGEKVSSTAVRTLACLGEDVRQFVNDGVWQYIEGNRLYGLKLDREIKEVRSLLTAERWAHTVRVALTCAENGSRANLTESEAITLGALHDCAKCLPEDSKLLDGFTPPRDVPPPVLHQFSGAFVAEHYFGVRDKKLLDAIGCHTTGRENMTDADVLLYLADLLEAGRSFDGVESLREIFKVNMRVCLKEALKRQLEYLKGTGAPIDERTLRAYNWIKDEKL